MGKGESAKCRPAMVLEGNGAGFRGRVAAADQKVRRGRATRGLGSRVRATRNVSWLRRVAPEDYRREIYELVEALPPDIREKATAPVVKPRYPGAATSGFIIRKRAADWTEDAVVSLFNDGKLPLRAVRYGEDSPVIVGEPGFREHWRSYQQEVLDIGKRPDVLIYAEDDPDAPDAHGVVDARSDDVSRAMAAVEVRSTSSLADVYARWAVDNPKAHPSLSFAIKETDLAATVKWIEHFGVPHYYVQVFRDSIFVAPLTDLLRVIADTPEGQLGGWYRDKGRGASKRQTFYVPITHGRPLARIIVQPDTNVETRITERGQVIHGINFQRGALHLEGFDAELLGATNDMIVVRDRRWR